MTSAQTYDIAGPSEAHAIVFLHGMRVTRRMWQPQLRSLSDEFRVIAVDLPGHGSLKNETFHVEHSVDEVAQLIDRVAAGRALVVGLSLGGYIAIELGACYPEKATGLVVASASVEPQGWYAFPYRIVSLLMSNLPERWLNAVSRSIFVAVYGERAQPLTSGGFFMRGGAAGIREVMNRKFAPSLAAYPGPVLLLNGAMDLGFRMHEKRFLAAAKKGRLEIIPKAFHISNIDQPAVFSDAIRRFARSLAW